MNSKNIYDKTLKKLCSVCGKTIDKDIYDQGDCPFCKWKNSYLADVNPNKVLYPNLVSLNKAIKLYKEGKAIEPNLDEFIEALNGYGEMQFKYKDVCYAVERVFDENKNIKICFYNSKTKESAYFVNDDDFKNNAKIGNEYLKDIWEQTTDRYWLQ